MNKQLTKEKSSPDIKSDVLTKRKFKPSVEDTNIGVMMKDGVGTLTGFKTSDGEKWEAIRNRNRVSDARLAADDVALRNPTSIFETVVAGDYCVGCGLCGGLSDKIRINWTDIKTYQPVRLGTLSHDEEAMLARVCPFGATALNEDQISAELFPGVQDHSLLGRHIATFAGVVCEQDFQEKGSSGGMGTWIAVEMLQKGMVTGIIHVGEIGATGPNTPVFGYRISRTTEEIRRNSKSRYYPIQVAEVIVQVKQASAGEVFAFVGIPCMVKAIRLACREDAALAGKIKYCIGLVCGHLKSGGFAELLAWQVGVKPEDLRSINFREKLPGENSNAYGFRAVGERDGQVQDVVASMKDVKGGDWGMGFFKLKACEFCDDVVGETADVVIGDAWLPAYTSDHRGANLLIVRNADFLVLLNEGAESGRIRLDKLSEADAVKTQASGFRHRREGLSYRLAVAQERNEWHPPKRTKPSKAGMGNKRRKIYRLRYDLSMQSHGAFLDAKIKNDLPSFFGAIHPVLSAYIQLTRPSRVRVFASKIKQLIKKLRKR